MGTACYKDVVDQGNMSNDNNNSGQDIESSMISLGTQQSPNQQLLFDKTDTNNMREIRKMKQHYNKLIVPKCIRIDSSYLLDRFQTEEKATKSSCKLLECAYLKEIIISLRLYHSFVKQNENPQSQNQEHSSMIINKSNIEIFNGNYSNTSTLNHFHHLLSIHAHQFEEIHDMLLEKCNNGKICSSSQCLMRKRNYRDRARLRLNDKNLNEMYFNRKNVNDVINQQILDRMHCHYFHSFDTGYKIPKQQILEIEQLVKNEEKKENDTEHNLSDRYVAAIYNHISNISNCDDIRSSKFSTMSNDVDLKYSFGVKYFYWEYYKNNVESFDPAFDDIYHSASLQAANQGYVLADFYVAAKYPNLKNEMLYNPIYSMSIGQWNHTVQKAEKYLEADCIKSEICSFGNNINTEKYYNIKKGSAVTVGHLTGIMLHCNQDTLQRKFGETYRRIPKSESNDSLIRRHSNYANLGRLLQELVDCFGGDKNAEKSLLYHGTSIVSQFPSVDVCIKGPCSTTSDYTVAVKFAGNKGMILELNTNMNARENGLFACQFVSDFVNEQEVFFIGGTRRFSILSIIRSSSGENYYRYIRALAKIVKHLYRCLEADMDGTDELIDKNENEAKMNQQIAFRMLSDELHRHFPENKDYAEFISMPCYVRKLLIYQFCNIKTITFYDDLISTFDELIIDSYDFYKKMFHYLFYYDYGWIKLELLIALFPSARTLRLWDNQQNEKFIHIPSVYWSIISFIKKSSKFHLTSIEINVSTLCDEKVQKAIAPFQTEFKQLNWTLSSYKDEYKTSIRMVSLSHK